RPGAAGPIGHRLGRPRPHRRRHRLPPGWAPTRRLGPDAMTSHSRTLGGPATRRRLLAQLALSIALAVAGSFVAHSSTATVAATCLPGYQCATVYYHLTGDGSGSVTSNP